MSQQSSNIPDRSIALDFSDDRCSPRFEADCFVVNRFRGRRVIATCLDFNQDGFGAIVEEPLPVGEILTVELPMTGGVPLKLQARVVYRQDSRHGFEFVAPEHFKRKLIAEFFRESGGTA